MATLPAEHSAGTTATASASSSSSLSSAGLLRFTTAGSVDDGKSTLIGRLLYDSQSVLEDQLASVQKSKVNRSTGPIDFSLLTDGLRAEREQGITIDVAYRYFTTPRRKFIIADTPGHEQYTRNMATGASTADAAIVLIDATKGVLRQSRRHAFIASLLGVRHIIAAVNKMDLVGFSQDVFERISAEFREFAAQLGIGSLYAVPVSALEGDNVVRGSKRMPWFEGPALLEYLETLELGGDAADGPLRFPVQYVIRPDASFRGFAGQLVSGELREGTTVMALPSLVKTRVKSIVAFEDEITSARPGDSIAITLEDEIDISRGNMLVAETDVPAAGTAFRATLVWMHAEPLDPHKIYVIKHTTRTVRGRINHIRHRIDVNTLEHVPAAKLDLNEIAAVDVKTTLPLFFDPYKKNRTTGSFIVIDPLTNATVGAGIIESAIAGGSHTHANERKRSTKEERILRFGHPAAAVWVQGRPRVAEMVERQMFDEGWHVQMAGPNDFLAHELVSVAKAFRLSGNITIFAPLDDGTNPKTVVRAIYGPESFFAVRITDDTDEEAVERIMKVLRKWRDSQSDAEKRKS
ncbi:MAG TPA: sulfate adenylyltransferase subunit CysN [Candidatus Baltobacteraceae bacterium]|nr:sulfate adenylyltransferase subunit CysN [Candidatus Baltobacteraceae bacterium]